MRGTQATGRRLVRTPQGQKRDRTVKEKLQEAPQRRDTQVGWRTEKALKDETQAETWREDGDSIRR